MDTKDMRDVTRRGYEQGRYAERYGTLNRLGPEEQSLLNAFLDHVPADGTVLDLGCGNGIPFTRAIAATGRGVVGVDLAETHIEQARATIPSGIFIHGDLTRILLEERRFAADRYAGAMMLFTLPHIPRPQHPALFEALHTLVKESFLVTIPLKERAPERGTIAGGEIAWNAWPPDVTLDLLRNAGFSIMQQAELHEPEDEAMTYRWVLAEA